MNATKNQSPSHPPSTLSALLRASGLGDATIIGDAHRTVVADVGSDSRRVICGGCFVAIRGTGFDGHGVADQAVKAGASCIVIERSSDIGPRGVAGATTVLVDDTRVALARLAAAYFLGTPLDIPIAGITGTNGKSTVAWMVHHILQVSGRFPALFGTIEYDLVGRRLDAPLTTPGPVELARGLSEAVGHGADSAVLEVSSHALHQHRTDGIGFRVAVFTNISGDHLDYHRDIDDYLACKARLFEQLPPDGMAVVNRDDAHFETIRTATRARVTGFSTARGENTGNSADIRASELRLSINGSVFKITGQGFDDTVHLPMPGEHNISNALAAAGCSLGLGVDRHDIIGALASCRGVPGRLEPVILPATAKEAEPQLHEPHARVFVDYAHTDDALEHVLTTLRPLTRGRLFCVFGCGGDRDRTKRPRMGRAVRRHADVVVVTSDNPRTEDPMAIIADVVAGWDTSASSLRPTVLIEPDRRAAIERAVMTAHASDTLLIAGKGHEAYQLVGDRRIPFDDVAVAREALARRASSVEDAA